MDVSFSNVEKHVDRLLYHCASESADGYAHVVVGVALDKVFVGLHAQAVVGHNVLRRSVCVDIIPRNYQCKEAVACRGVWIPFRGVGVEWDFLQIMVFRL